MFIYIWYFKILILSQSWESTGILVIIIIFSLHVSVYWLFHRTDLIDMLLIIFFINNNFPVLIHLKKKKNLVTVYNKVPLVNHIS